MAQSSIYGPWGGTKGSWLHLMSTLLSSGRLWLLSFVSAFLISLIKLILWLKFSIGKSQAEKMGEGPQGPALFQYNRIVTYSPKELTIY